MKAKKRELDMKIMGLFLEIIIYLSLICLMRRKKNNF